MPITSSEPIVDFTTLEFGKFDYRVMSHAFASQKALGRLADEIVCHRELEIQLVDAGIQIQFSAAG